MERRSPGPALPQGCSCSPCPERGNHSLGSSTAEPPPFGFAFHFQQPGAAGGPLFYHMWFAERCPVTRALCRDVGTAQRRLGLKRPPGGTWGQVWGSEGERRGLILSHPLELSGAVSALPPQGCSLTTPGKTRIQANSFSHLPNPLAAEATAGWQPEGFYQNKQRNLNPNPFSNTENAWRKGTSAPEPCLASQQAAFPAWKKGMRTTSGLKPGSNPTPGTHLRPPSATAAPCTAAPTSCPPHHLLSANGSRHPLLSFMRVWGDVLEQRWVGRERNALCSPAGSRCQRWCPTPGGPGAELNTVCSD